MKADAAIFRTHVEKGEPKLPHLAEFKRWNPNVEVHTAIGPVSEDRSEWRNCDRTLRDFWKENHNKVKGSVIAVIEWDVLVTCELPELPEGSEVASKTVATLITNRGWHWFREIPRLGQGITPVGVVPFAFILLRREVLDFLVSSQWDHLYDKDIFSELRFGSIAASQFSCSAIDLPHVSWNRTTFDGGSGIYHPVKFSVATKYDRSNGLLPMNKTIHVTWAQGESELPMKFRQNLDLWEKALPDWELEIWDIEKASARWEDFKKHHGRCFHHATRSDLIQTRVMRDIGGIYIGTDSKPALGLPRFIELIETVNEAIVLDLRGNAAMNCLSFSRGGGSDFWSCAVNHQMRENCGKLGQKDVHWATGPGCLWEALKAHNWSIHMIPMREAYTHHWAKGRYPRNPDAYCDPGYAASWH